MMKVKAKPKAKGTSRGDWRGETLARMRALILEARRAIDIHEGEKIDAGAFKALVKAAVARNGSHS